MRRCETRAQESFPFRNARRNERIRKDSRFVNALRRDERLLRTADRDRQNRRNVIFRSRTQRDSPLAKRRAGVIRNLAQVLRQFGMLPQMA